MKSLKEAENKAFCPHQHQLTYGAWQERQAAETEQVKEIQGQEPDKIEELEAQWAQEKEGGK